MSQLEENVNLFSSFSSLIGHNYMKKEEKANIKKKIPAAAAAKSLQSCLTLCDP